MGDHPDGAGAETTGGGEHSPSIALHLAGPYHQPLRLVLRRAALPTFFFGGAVDFLADRFETRTELPALRFPAEVAFLVVRLGPLRALALADAFVVSADVLPLGTPTGKATGDSGSAIRSRALRSL